MDPRLVQVLSVALCEVGFIFICAGIASDPWKIYSYNKEMERWHGLWTKCNATIGSTGGNCTQLVVVEGILLFYVVTLKKVIKGGGCD